MAYKATFKKQMYVNIKKKTHKSNNNYQNKFNQNYSH